MDDDYYEQTGMTHDRAGIRIDRMIEGIKVLRGLWGDDAFSFEGDHYTISEMNGLPKPVQAGGPPSSLVAVANVCCRPQHVWPTLWA